MYKPFLCRKHYSGKKQKDPLGKARVPRMASFAFTCLASLVSIHVPRNNSVLSLEVSVIYAALQGTTWSHFPRLFQEPVVFVFFIVLSVYSLVCLWNCRFPILIFPTAPLTFSKILHALG